MSDILLQIARLTEARATIYAKTDGWTEADRDRLHTLAEQIDRLWRLRRAELAKQPIDAVPLGDFAVDQPTGWAQHWRRSDEP